MAEISSSENEWLEKVTVAPGIELSRALAEYWPQIEASKRPYVEINATAGQPSTFWESSFGYYPALPKGFPYPKDSVGYWMYPLAQINFAQVPSLPNFPKTGLLQFYISAYDDYGLDFDNPMSQQLFRVLFFEEDQLQDIQNDFSFLADIIASNNSPVSKSHTLSFVRKDDYMGPNEIAFNKNFSFRDELAERFPSLLDQLEQECWDAFASHGHRLDGYACFTQDDPRDSGRGEKSFQLLFQMDTDKDIMWGDAGVGNFFIDPANLARKDFSRVLYNWDCC